MKRSTVRKIAKKYGFAIDEFNEYSWGGGYVTFFRRIDYPDFYWHEEDWFETEQMCDGYFMRWSKIWSETDADGCLLNGVKYEK